MPELPRYPLTEQELARIESRARFAADALRSSGIGGAAAAVAAEDVPCLVAEVRRAQQAEERLYQFIRQKGMGMELQRFQEQQRAAEGEG